MHAPVEKTFDVIVIGTGPGGEGAAMEYIPQILLFNREFAFNIEDVLRKYLNDSSAS